jgi:hypothetical protein
LGVVAVLSARAEWTGDRGDRDGVLEVAIGDAVIRFDASVEVSYVASLVRALGEP